MKRSSFLVAWRSIAGALALVLTAAIPVRGQTGADHAVAGDSRSAVDEVVLRPGDVVRIMVWQKPELSGDFLVGQDGTLADPFYMNVRVTDVPFASAATRIREYIRQYEMNPRILVQPLLRVAVSGEVRKPDLLSVPAGTTIAEAVLLAGGPTENAAVGRARVLRDGRWQRVDLGTAAPGLAGERLRSGEQIVVPRRRNVMREVVGPVSSLAGAVISIAYIVTRYF